MKQQSSPSFQELEARVRLLQELAGSLETARNAVLQSRVADLDRQTCRQRELCSALQEFPCDVLAGAGERWNRLLEQCAELEARVAELNRGYGALLARARRTVDIFCRILESSRATYLPPRREPLNLPSGVEG